MINFTIFVNAKVIKNIQIIGIIYALSQVWEQKNHLIN